jgi:glycerol-1-phosphate dehydrogenase [NAD(P)+]
MIEQIIKKYINQPMDVVIEAGLRNRIGDIIKTIDIGTRVTIVSDKNTYEILGKTVENSIGNVIIDSLVFDSNITADIKNVNIVRETARFSDMIIAVGSGTINDLCKYAGHLNNIPYIVFATAPSMNGYSSANASISINGYKQTFKAQLARAIFFDLDILANAPIRLIKSGLGDSICRPTCQADWLLSHLLLGTKYDETPFNILKTVENELFENSEALIRQDRQALKLLCQTLILSGIGMYISNGSYPASQGEHLIAHTMETILKKGYPHSFHGEQIGVTTLTMAEIIEHNLQNIPVIKGNFDENVIYNFYGKNLGDKYSREYNSKVFSAAMIEQLNTYIQNNWHNISHKISSVMISRDKLKNILSNAQAAVSYKDIGWTKNSYQLGILHAKYMRNRFGFLDLN